MLSLTCGGPLGLAARGHGTPVPARSAAAQSRHSAVAPHSRAPRADANPNERKPKPKAGPGGRCAGARGAGAGRGGAGARLSL